eukprot:COSAG02_NODE_6400_length_3599_cov_1.894571_3_plen_74_part_00
MERFCNGLPVAVVVTVVYRVLMVQVQVLIEHGASPLVLDRKGRTPAVRMIISTPAHCGVALAQLLAPECARDG